MKKTKFTATGAPALMAFLGSAGIKLVDIGGRGAALPQLERLAPVSHYYTCEPDVVEAARLGDALVAAETWRGVTVLTEAIASQPGDHTLYLTRALGMSSLLRPDPSVTDRFFLAHKFEVDRTITVPAITLDEAAATYGFTDACFLKIDTQGTELDILQSGNRLVRESLLGVYVECSFRPFYMGQALFGDVDAFLRANGFDLFTMSRTNLRRAGFRPTLYSKRVTTWAHCLYLREPGTLAARASGRLSQDVPRLLALAIAFQQHDLAFDLVDLAAREGLLDPSVAEAVAADLQSVVESYTGALLRKARKQGLADEVLAPDLRDRKSLH